MIQEYIAYLKDNPEGYWFKRKLYGWGWTPATWQGWFLMSTYIIFVCIVALSIDKNLSFNENIFIFILPLVIFTAILLYICYKKGEKPKWQWGIPKKDK